MSDKTARHGKPRGKTYCDTPGTSCFYALTAESKELCVNCLRPKGWRLTKHNRARLDRRAGR